MAHAEEHSLAGQKVKLNLVNADPATPAPEVVVEDWWDRLTGGSWMHANGNPTALKYALRAGFAGLPTDDEVVYVKVGGFGHLVHVSELGDVVEAVTV